MIYTPELNDLETAIRHYNKVHEMFWNAMMDGNLREIQHYGTTLSKLTEQIVRLAGRLSVQRPAMTTARLAGLDAQG